MDINRISHTEIQAWAWLHRIQPLPWEVEAITGIDAAFVDSILADREKPKP